MTLSEKLYHALLYLYPADFRREYGDEMRLIFRDMMRDDPNMLRLWGRTLIDLVPSIIFEYVETIGDYPMTTIKIDEYEVQAHLENGATSSIYLVKNPTAQQPAIMKLWRPEDNIDSDTLKREVDAMIALKHSSIPEVYTYTANDKQPYYVMEYIAGDTLLKRMQQSAEFIDEATLINWGIQACDILTHLHTHQPQPYLFRDVKPSNFILSDDNQLHMIDFGIAVPYKPDKTYDRIGTIGYASPEAYQGIVTPRSDIYSLGATLHHLATKLDPRPDHNSQAFTFAPLRSINLDYSRAFADVIHRATCYEPDSRFASADEMKTALIACQI